ncbi:unnamed protein product [Psylliodes chrysocephalus]|uniref:Uncharacterized protein n=1 Tax=Psylliodes chrysocephalus TaxID=3402493 RepID=A0A9P0D7F4_9CUCU|nr:unnamed protein product [Psylliodes chrysocephala]
MHMDSNLKEENDLTDLEENDCIEKVALYLRKTILNINKFKFKSKIKVEDLINSEYSIPEKLERFYKVFIAGKYIHRRNGVNCDRLANSMASDAIFCVNSGTVILSKLITYNTIKSLTNSRKGIIILNRFGHCCNYNTLVEEFETEATIASVDSSQISPPDIIRSPLLCTAVEFDNFDRFVDTLNGKETLHDTVGIIYQNVNNNVQEELNVDNASNNSEETLPGP